MGQLFGAKSGAEKQLSSDVKSGIGDLQDVAGTGEFQGRKALKAGRRDLMDVGGFFRKLLSGDRTETTQALSPEIQAVKDQYDSTKRSISEYGPRGGGQVAAIGQASEKEAGRIGGLFSTARSRGAAGLGQVGQVLGQLGLGGLNLASSSLGDILHTLVAEQGVEAGVSERKSAALGGLGSLIGSLIPLP